MSTRQPDTASADDAPNSGITKIAARNDAIAAQTGRRPSAFTRTFGCQQNEADTERLRGQLSAMGFTLTDSLEEADLCLLNACAVRDHAENRALGHVGGLSHWKRERPDRVLVLCGCMAQQPEVVELTRRSYPYVTILFGPAALPRFPDLLLTHYTTGKRVTDISEEISEDSVEPLRGSYPKAWVSIMQGCNNFCSYCVVPYVRGRERSRPAHEIIGEVESLIAQGYKDMTLLGQNVNSYRDGRVDFKELLRRVCSLGGDFWVRFMTSHPKDCTIELLETMAALPPMARHLHLPVQAGSDRVLAAMNRGYTGDGYLSLLESARRLMPDLTVTTDIIVGFPGETEAEFEDTLRLAEAGRFDQAYTFQYSRRRGTPAAALEELSKEVKQARFERLLELQNRISLERQQRFENQTLRVLIGGEDTGNPYPLTARTTGGRLVRLKGDPALVGQFAAAEITSLNTWNLFGRVRDAWPL